MDRRIKDFSIFTFSKTPITHLIYSFYCSLYVPPQVATYLITIYIFLWQNCTLHHIHHLPKLHQNLTSPTLREQLTQYLGILGRRYTHMHTLQQYQAMNGCTDDTAILVDLQPSCYISLLQKHIWSKIWVPCLLGNQVYAPVPLHFQSRNIFACFLSQKSSETQACCKSGYSSLKHMHKERLHSHQGQNSSSATQSKKQIKTSKHLITKFNQGPTSNKKK